MDNELLIKLIKRAQGQLSQNEFAKRCDISSSNLTRIYRNTQSPTPALLKKIADNSQANISYKHLMVAAGYWEDRFAETMYNETDVLSKKLKSARIKSGFTISQLSDQTGIPEDIIQKLENNKPVNFSHSVIIELAKILNVGPSYLAGYDITKDVVSKYLAKSSLDEFTKKLRNLDAEFQNEFIQSLNHLISVITMLERNGEEISITECRFSFPSIMHSIACIYEDVLQYKNLYRDYQTITSDTVLQSPQYISNIRELDTSTGLLLGLVSSGKKAEIELSIKKRLHRIQSRVLNDCHELYDKYYNDLSDVSQIDEG